MRRLRIWIMMAAVCLVSMIIVAVPVNAVGIEAEEVSYIDENGTNQTADAINIAELTTSDEQLVLGQAGETNWYYVSGEFTSGKDLVIRGDVRLILTDSSHAHLENNNIRGGSGDSLHIYGQQGGNGKLTANKIGGDFDGLDFCGGIINTGKIIDREAASRITAGTVNVHSEDGGGILLKSLEVKGGTLDISCKAKLDAGNLLIAEGLVTDGDLKIYGGNVSSHVYITNDYAQAEAVEIYAIASGDIDISGGNVTATFDAFDPSGITGASYVRAYGMYSKDDIILGWTDRSDSITATNYKGYVEIQDGKQLFAGGKLYKGKLTDEQVAEIAGKTLRPAADEVSYIDENGAKQTAEAIDISNLTTEDGQLVLGWDGETSWYYVSGEFTSGNDLVCRGNVNLILTDGSHADFTDKNISGVSNSSDKLHIYGQQGGSGKLTAMKIGGYFDGLDFFGGIINTGKIYAADADSRITAGTVKVDCYDENGILLKALEVKGGTLDIECKAELKNNDVIAEGLVTYGVLKIYGGEVRSHVTVTNDIANAQYVYVSAIASTKDIQILGGTVTALVDKFTVPEIENVTIRGIKSNNIITLGWTDRSDSITATNYRGYVVIEKGKKLVANGVVYEGELTDDQIAEIAGRTLMPSGDEVAYIDEKGEVQNAIANDLSSFATGSKQIVLGWDGETTWYYVSGEFTSKNDLTCRGDVRLILPDDSHAYLEDNNIRGGSGDSLHIYGQSKGNGQLDINSVELGTLEVSGGMLNVKCRAQLDGSSYLYATGIHTYGELRINGGEVSSHIEFPEDCMGATFGIVQSISCNGFDFSGGKVTATTDDFTGVDDGFVTLFGLVSYKDIKLSWTDLSDSIMADSYTTDAFSGTVMIEKGKPLTDGEDIYEGKLTHAQILKIAGRRLTPDPTPTPGPTPTPDPTPTPTPDPAPAPGEDLDSKVTDGTALGPGASAAAAEYAITHMTGDKDPAGAVYIKLRAKSTKQTKDSVKLTWSKTGDAVKYVIYGNAGGSKNKMKKLAVSTGRSKTIKKIAGKKLKKGTYYKFIIVALDKDDIVVSTSRMVHVATKGGKAGNHRKVTVSKSVIAKAKKLKKGSKLKLNARAVKTAGHTVKKYRAVSYESGNTKAATVSKKGVVKAKAKGSCYIYAYAQNGVAKKIRIKVR